MRLTRRYLGLAVLATLVTASQPRSWLVAPTALAQAPRCEAGFSSSKSGSPVNWASDRPSFVAVGRFNGDGFDDLAVANVDSGIAQYSPMSPNTVTILLGDGAGSFTRAAGSPIPVGIRPVSVAVGRYNPDGYDDLAVANADSNTVTILLGNGAGGFAQATGSPVAAGSYPASVAVGRFNNDGVVDLVIAGGDTFGGEVRVLLGNGAGGFVQAAGSPIAVGYHASSVAVGSFNLTNGDNLSDLAVAVTNIFSRAFPQPGHVRVFLNTAAVDTYGSYGRAYANYAYLYAYYDYAAYGTTNSYYSYVNSYYGDLYSAYGSYYWAAGEHSTAAYYWYYAAQYSHAGYQYAYADYQANGNAYAYYAYVNGYYAYLYNNYAYFYANAYCE